jgi:iron complex outermembrane receptor protein
MVIADYAKTNIHWLVPVLILQAQLGQARELSEADFLASAPPVLTASRLAQPIMDAPNAITVLDRATIEATGYHNLSDLFRLVPGMYVGQASGWFHNVSHSIADEYSRRMQVLVDGRSVYLPSIGGVRWDSLPLAIDDIERIEVVRGPNAATFGANAFTGVINIITRHPADVAGKMLHLIAGDHGHREGWFRWAGGNETASHRLTLGRREDGGFADLVDDERSNILNYRGEYRLPAMQTLGLQFGYLDGTRGAGDSGNPLEQPHQQDLASSFAQADYRRVLAPDAEVLAKVYFNHLQTREDVPVVGALVDRVSRIPGAAYYEQDVLSQRWHGEIQYNQDHGHGLRSAVGAYLRRDTVGSSRFFGTASDLNVDSQGVFGHLEWRMAPAWLLNTGAFWENHEEAGKRLSPRATLSWQPSPFHSFRIGVSKAYRNPFAYETSADSRIAMLDANGDVLFQTLPRDLSTRKIEPEELVSREIGYLGRWPKQGVDLDLRLYREHLTDYISFECPPVMDGTGEKSLCNPALHYYGIPGAGLVARDVYNVGGALQQGFESQLRWRPSPHTQVLANYAYLHIDSDFEETRYFPHHLAGLHLMHQFPGAIDLTLSHYWISAFEPIGQKPLPAARRWDARLAKSFRMGEANAVAALGVENLGGSYLEFSNTPENAFDTHAYVHLKVDF